MYVEVDAADGIDDKKYGLIFSYKFINIILSKLRNMLSLLFQYISDVSFDLSIRPATDKLMNGIEYTTKYLKTSR